MPGKTKAERLETIAALERQEAIIKELRKQRYSQSHAAMVAIRKSPTPRQKAVNK